MRYASAESLAYLGQTDGTTNTVYRLSGASWFGGNLNYVNGKYEFADTEFFNILAPSGGVVAKVAGVEHAGSGGSNFSFTFGQCEAPQDRARVEWLGMPTASRHPQPSLLAIWP